MYEYLYVYIGHEFIRSMNHVYHTATLICWHVQPLQHHCRISNQIWDDNIVIPTHLQHNSPLYNNCAKDSLLNVPNCLSVSPNGCYNVQLSLCKIKIVFLIIHFFRCYEKLGNFHVVSHDNIATSVF